MNWLTGLIVSCALWTHAPMMQGPMPAREVPHPAARTFSIFKEVRYRAAEEALILTFRNGREYEYLGVKPETVLALQEAGSQGRYFNKTIKGHYPTRRLFSIQGVDMALNVPLGSARWTR